jgi:PilZ domain-containing protein
MDYEIVNTDHRDSGNAAQERTAYLQKLNELGGSAPSESKEVEIATGTKERRRSIRYRCDGSAELRPKDSDVRTWGTLSDISMHGCYIEMTATYPVGTFVDLSLEAVGVRVHVAGEVKVSYPFLGIGIAFREVASEQRENLRELLQRLSTNGRSIRPEPAAIGSDGLPVSLPSPNHAYEMVKELANFFQNHPDLPQATFGEILARWTSSQ